MHIQSIYVGISVLLFNLSCLSTFYCTNCVSSIPGIVRVKVLKSSLARRDCPFKKPLGAILKWRLHNFRDFGPPPPLVYILARSIRLNPRNLPYYVCILLTPPSPPLCRRHLCMAPKRNLTTNCLWLWYSLTDLMHLLLEESRKQQTNLASKFMT